MKVVKPLLKKRSAEKKTRNEKSGKKKIKVLERNFLERKPIKFVSSGIVVEEIKGDKKDTAIRPENLSGAWQIFEGIVKIELVKEAKPQILPEVDLISFNDWENLRIFSKPPNSLNFKFGEILSKEEIFLKLREKELFGLRDDQNRDQAVESKKKAIGGILKTKGLNRIAFKNYFYTKFTKEKFPFIKFSNSKLAVFPRDLIDEIELESYWSEVFENLEKIKELDCDFLWILLKDNFEKCKIPILPKVYEKKLEKKETGEMEQKRLKEMLHKSKDLSPDSKENCKKSHFVRLSKVAAISEKKINPGKKSAKKISAIDRLLDSDTKPNQEALANSELEQNTPEE